MIDREPNRPTRCIKESVHIRKEGQQAMNRDEGSYQPSNAYDSLKNQAIFCKLFLAFGTMLVNDVLNLENNNNIKNNRQRERKKERKINYPKGSTSTSTNGTYTQRRQKQSGLLWRVSPNTPPFPPLPTLPPFLPFPPPPLLLSLPFFPSVPPFLPLPLFPFPAPLPLP